MTYKKIINQFPSHTVYEGENPDHVYHSFGDTYHCPITGTMHEIHGKGALCHRISAFLFAKLNQLNIPSHFVGTRNMRESLMQATQSLPFNLRIHSRASPEIALDFEVPEDMVFDPPLVEYLTASKKYHANEDFLTAMGWVDQDEMEEIHALAIRTTHCLQGLFVGCDLGLIQIELTLARSFDNPFVVAGTLSPETLLLRDLRTGQIWNKTLSEIQDDQPLQPYILLAQRLGLYADRSCDATADAPMPSFSEPAIPPTHTVLSGDENPCSKLLKITENWPKNVLLFPNAKIPTPS